MDTTELLKTAAEPHLIISAGKCHELIAEMNALISHLRLEVSEKELIADLHHNFLLQQEGKNIPLKESEYKISEQYKEWQKKKGTLTDIRALRKNLERHSEMLSSSERFGSYQGKAYLG